MKALLLSLALTSAGIAHAAAPEAAYLEARDRLIEDFAKSGDRIDTSLLDDKDQQALIKLQTRLQALIGPISVDGFSSEGLNNLETLQQGMGFGRLDGLEYPALSGHDSLYVTTDGLFKAWLASDPDRAQNPDEALHRDDTYSYALVTNAGFIRYAELPVIIPSGRGAAVAMLGHIAQDWTPDMPQEIFIGAKIDGYVFLVQTSAAVTLESIPACLSIRDPFEKASKEALDAYQAGALQDRQQLDMAWDLEAQGYKALIACIGRELPAQPYYPALVHKVQAQVDAILHRR